MKHIVCYIHPFVIEQEVYIYDEGKCVKTTKCNFNDLEETLYTLSKEYNISQIDLSGSQLYGLKIKDNMTSNKYDLNNLTITVH